MYELVNKKQTALINRIFNVQKKEREYLQNGKANDRPPKNWVRLDDIISVCNCCSYNKIVLRKNHQKKSKHT